LDIQSNRLKAGLAVATLLLSSISSAEIVRIEYRVESITLDEFVGAQIGDVIGYAEYDNTGLVRRGEVIDETTVDYTVLTDFNLDIGGIEYGLETVDYNQVVLDDDNLYENPYIQFFLVYENLYLDMTYYTPDLYRFLGQESDTGNSFDMDISATVVPVPAAAYLFASCLGLLGWFRRRQSA
jgi:hypothetical protein